MSGKVKMRCAKCNKSFKSVSPKHTLCPECETKERMARAATRVTGPKPVATPVKTQQPTIVGPGASILVPGLALGNQPSTPEHLSHTVRPHDPMERRHPSYSTGSAEGAGQSGEHLPKVTRDSRQATRDSKQPRVGQVPSEASPSATVVSNELRTRIEERYQELAQPVEFDGIRTQIAIELGVPKPVVKRTVAQLRQRLNLPSWWELQSYSGTTSDLERIRTAYMPYLPVPEVGIHKRLAIELGLDAGLVYQGIHRVRAEMHLPQYNPPEAHKVAPPPEAVLGGPMLE
jgi:hypothetical protein